MKQEKKRDNERRQRCN